MITRRQLLQYVGAVAVCAWVAGCGAPTSSTGVVVGKPNIIYILVDDLGYGDLGCYGQTRIQTPNIDRMAAEGMRFTNHYAGSTVCAPSRCCLMTGLHTGHAWVRANGRLPLRPEDVTVAELLKGAGYTTGIIGKWGLGEAETTGIPNRQGFDHWFGYLNQRHAHNYYPEFLWDNEEKVTLNNKVIDKGRLGGVATERVDYSHDLFAARALRFVEDHRDHPFFLYLALTIPHANNEAGNEGMEVPSYAPYEDKTWPDAQKGHAAMITRMDRDIGRLLDRLKDLGLDEKTLVIFTSDNGPHKEGGADPTYFKSSGPLRGYKRALYEGGIRVPMIARWPGRIEAGAQSDHISAFWDFLPTCCDLVGIETPAGLDGISMLPTLIGRSADQRRHPYLYWEFHEQGKRQAIRWGRWKAVRNNVRAQPDGPLELYDLQEDISEQTDVSSGHPEIVLKIEGLLAGARVPSERWPFP
ncbi:MAG: arylsulfatase [Planctomycetes bacterium]|nr:arylsulfatase [Planctomycetota bacterium]